MASGFFALFDDIATVLDDVAVMSKIAMKKTAGIAGDDLAVGSEQMAGLDPKRELPVIRKVAMGSLKNKAFLVPGALALNFAAPWIITPILMAGGAYLCYEGVEKILHHKNKKDASHDKALIDAFHQGPDALLRFEEDKIKKAIRTDTILSGEIIAISLASVAHSPFVTQATTLTVVALIMTVGIYGAVAAIVKIDDVGLYMLKKTGAGLYASLYRAIGQGLVSAAAPIMKSLSFIGTAAMFMVGGGILAHGVPVIGHGIADAAAAVTANGFLKGTLVIAGEAIVGIIAGIITLKAVQLLEKPVAKIILRIKKRGA
jgi:predicted DNA repair protein MutK